MTGKTLAFEDVELGDEIGPVERVVTDEHVAEFLSLWRAYRGRSRFTDDEIARTEGLPGPIVPGAMNTAMMSQLVADWAQNIALKKLDVVFRAVVVHGVPLKVRGVVTDKATVAGEPRLDCDVFIENEAGTPLVIGKATVALSTETPLPR